MMVPQLRSLSSFYHTLCLVNTDALLYDHAYISEDHMLSQQGATVNQIYMPAVTSSWEETS